MIKLVFKRIPYNTRNTTVHGNPYKMVVNDAYTIVI